MKKPEIAERPRLILVNLYTSRGAKSFLHVAVDEELSRYEPSGHELVERRRRR